MEQQFYVGIDLDDENAIISFFQQNMKEPETVSTVAGSEVFQIPLWLTKKKGIGQWFIGEEARKLALEQEALGADRYQGTVKFLSKAIRGERIFVEGEEYPASNLLALYIRKLMLLAGTPRHARSKGIWELSPNAISGVSSAAQANVSLLASGITEIFTLIPVWGVNSVSASFCSRSTWVSALDTQIVNSSSWVAVVLYLSETKE